MNYISRISSWYASQICIVIAIDSHIKQAAVDTIFNISLILSYNPTDYREVRAEYSGRINVMERRIADLEKLVASLEETITSKNEIISMLKKKLGEDK